LSLRGILPVLQTPFDEEGAVDHLTLARLVRFALTSGAAGVVYPANASEFHVLSSRERLDAVEVVSAAADGSNVIISATGRDADEAAAYARQAAELGAQAVMAIPPRASIEEITDYFVRCAEESELPLILQSVVGQVGMALDDERLDHLLERVPQIEYVKEERSPTTHMISGLLARYDGRLEGVIGGANGQWLLQETSRGACGCMPAGALVDLQVPIYDAAQEDEWERARELQARLQPLLAYTSIYGVSMVKEILHMRGLVPNASTRDPAAVPLDDGDRVELARLLADIPEVPSDG
jgi:dihydrodipicolinate synthase/N-acetylneuraminate lyase